MANAVPVHSTPSKKGKQVNAEPNGEAGSPVQSSIEVGTGPIQQSQGPVPEPVPGLVPQGVKLESHDAYRVDY